MVVAMSESRPTLDAYESFRDSSTYWLVSCEFCKVWHQHGPRGGPRECRCVDRDSWQWWVGDWINYGEKKYGETYKAAIEVTGRSIGTLKNIASVAAAVERSRRRDLSFAHHVAVASLRHEHQDELLDRAKLNGWPRSRLRDEVRALQGEEKPEIPTCLERVKKIWDKADEASKDEIRAFVNEA